MDVAISDLRANLSKWLKEAQDGEDVVVTDHGTPVVRIVAVTAASKLEQLVEQGVISRPTRPARPGAATARRPRPSSSVADIVDEHRY